MPVLLNSSHWMLVTLSAGLVFGLNCPVGTSGLTMFSENNAVGFRQRRKVSIVQNTVISERHAEDRITAGTDGLLSLI